MMSSTNSATSSRACIGRNQPSELRQQSLVVERRGELAQQLEEVHAEVPCRDRTEAVVVQQRGERSVAEDVDVARGRQVAPHRFRELRLNGRAECIGARHLEHEHPAVRGQAPPRRRHEAGGLRRVFEQAPARHQVVVPGLRCNGQKILAAEIDGERGLGEGHGRSIDFVALGGQARAAAAGHEVPPSGADIDDAPQVAAITLPINCAHPVELRGYDLAQALIEAFLRDIFVRIVIVFREHAIENVLRRLLAHEQMRAASAPLIRDPVNSAERFLGGDRGAATGTMLDSPARCAWGIELGDRIGDLCGPITQLRGRLSLHAQHVERFAETHLHGIGGDDLAGVVAQLPALSAVCTIERKRQVARSCPARRHESGALARADVQPTAGIELPRNIMRLPGPAP